MLRVSPRLPAQEPITLAAASGAADQTARCGARVVLLCAAAMLRLMRARACDSLGSAARPAAQISGRISVVRSTRHRSMDVSVEYEPRCADGGAQAALRQVMMYEV